VVVLPLVAEGLRLVAGDLAGELVRPALVFLLQCQPQTQPLGIFFNIWAAMVNKACWILNPMRLKEMILHRRLSLRLYDASFVFLDLCSGPDLISDLPDMSGETVLFQRVCYLWIDMRRNVV
jgi:hypothetical protein